MFNSRSPAKAKWKRPQPVHVSEAEPFGGGTETVTPTTAEGKAQMTYKMKGTNTKQSSGTLGRRVKSRATSASNSEQFNSRLVVATAKFGRKDQASA
jgi:hypothetical protein